jgi:hypothetical protein
MLRKKGRKQFFFEKKNQKTFTRCGGLQEQKFFVSFFQKRNASLLRHYRTPPIGRSFIPRARPQQGAKASPRKWRMRDAETPLSKPGWQPDKA